MRRKEINWSLFFSWYLFFILVFAKCQIFQRFVGIERCFNNGSHLRNRERESESMDLSFKMRKKNHQKIANNFAWFPIKVFLIIFFLNKSKKKIVISITNQDVQVESMCENAKFQSVFFLWKRVKNEFAISLNQRRVKIRRQKKKKQTTGIDWANFATFFSRVAIEKRVETAIKNRNVNPTSQRKTEC